MTWQEALMLLHERGWQGELIDEACDALLEACAEGTLLGKLPSELSEREVTAILRHSPESDEVLALQAVADTWDQADADGDELRAALVDLDAFADRLGEE